METITSQQDSGDTTKAGQPDEPETASVPTAAAARPELAWSQDDESDEPVSERVPWLTAWGIVAVIAACSAVLAGALGIGLWASRFGHSDVSPVITTAPAVSAQPAPTVKPPPPSTVTVTAAPPAPPTTTTLTPQERDSRFVALVAPKLPPKYNDRLPETAQQVCVDIAQGRSQPQEVASFLGKHPNDDELTWDGLSFFVATAVKMYCPELGRSQAPTISPIPK